MVRSARDDDPVVWSMFNPPRISVADTGPGIPSQDLPFIAGVLARPPWAYRYSPVAPVHRRPALKHEEEIAMSSTLVHVGVRSTDLEKTIRFWRDGLGLRVVSQRGDECYDLSDGHYNFRVFQHKGPERPSHVSGMLDYLHIGLRVANLEEVGEAWRAVMGRTYPVMAAIEVSGFIEDGAKLEIEATAVVPENERPGSEVRQV